MNACRRPTPSRENWFPLIPDEDLNTWGDEFVARNIKKGEKKKGVMDFEQYATIKFWLREQIISRLDF